MLEPRYRNAILLTWDGDAATARQWELGPSPSGDGLGLMAGWTVPSEQGGVPPAVARTFARAMARRGRVTFPCSTIAAPSGEGGGAEACWRPVRAAGDDHALFAQEAGNFGARLGRLLSGLGARPSGSSCRRLRTLDVSRAGLANAASPRTFAP